MMSSKRRSFWGEEVLGRRIDEERGVEVSELDAKLVY